MKKKQIPIWICKFLILISFNATMEIWNTYNLSFWLILENKTILKQTEEKKDVGRSFVDQTRLQIKITGKNLLLLN